MSNNLANSGAKPSRSVLFGAAFLMATSAIGPGFLTQTSTFTAQHGAALALVIVLVILMDITAQMNIWSVVSVSGMRAQDVANKLLPGLGVIIAILVAIGGLAFNVGNVGGVALGFNAMLGLDQKIGAIIAGCLGILIFVNKNAKTIMDKVATVLAAVVILAVMFVRRDRMDVRFLAKVALPLAVIALALLPFAHSAIAYLVAFLLKFAYVWFTFFVLLVLAGICYRYEVPSLRVFAIARASSEAAILLGIVLRRGFQGNGYMDSEAFAVAFAVGMLLCAFAMMGGNFPLLVAGFMLLGFMYGANMCSMSTMVGTFFGPKYYGINYAIATCQMIPAAIIGPQILALSQMGSGSYLGAFWVFFAVALAALVVSFFIKPPKQA